MLYWCGYDLRVFASVMFAAEATQWSTCRSAHNDVLVMGAFGPCACRPEIFAGTILSVNGEQEAPPLYTNRTLQVGSGGEPFPYGAAEWVNQRYREYTGPITINAVAYINSNCVPERERMADQLSKQVRVIAMGRCRGSSATIEHAPVQAHWTINYKNLQGFPYVIAADHAKAPGYVTEKPFVAAAAGATPIYWGDHKLLQRYIAHDRMLVWNKSTVEIVAKAIGSGKRTAQRRSVDLGRIYKDMATLAVKLRAL